MALFVFLCTFVFAFVLRRAALPLVTRACPFGDSSAVIFGGSLRGRVPQRRVQHARGIRQVPPRLGRRRSFTPSQELGNPYAPGVEGRQRRCVGSVRRDFLDGVRSREVIQCMIDWWIDWLIYTYS